MPAPKLLLCSEAPIDDNIREKYGNNLTSRLSRCRIILDFMINLRPDQLDIADLDTIYLPSDVSILDAAALSHLNFLIRLVRCSK